nr:hypothetical protein Iba_chr01bCG0060 [Ipomoea batatas]
MSDSDSQNASARDYVDAVETTPTDESSANSTRSPREIEGAGGRGGDRSPRRGKSPRVVISHIYDRLPTYSPTSRETLQRTLPPRPASSQAVSVPGSSSQPSSSQPLASIEGDLVPLSSGDVRNQPCLLTVSELEEIKSLLTGQVDQLCLLTVIDQSYEYWIFRSLASVKATGLEPPDYSQLEEYVPKRAIAPTLPPPAPEPVNPEMVLERSFAPAPTGPKKSRPKVTLGGHKPSQPSETPSGLAPPALPSGTTGTETGSADLQITRAPSKRGKEKTTDPEVEEDPAFEKAETS